MYKNIITTQWLYIVVGNSLYVLLNLSQLVILETFQPESLPKPNFKLNRVRVTMI
jgi:hypothetical protein